MRCTYKGIIGITAAVASLATIGIATPATAAPSTPPVETAPPVETEVLIDQNEATLDGPGGTFDLVAQESASTDVEVEASEGGASIDIVSTVENAATPTATYVLDIPSGASAKEITNESGVRSVMLTNDAGELLGGIAPLEAVDATGNIVATDMRLNGDSVTQTISDEADVNYPVTIRAAAGTVWYRNAYVSTHSRGYIVNANATALGRQQIAPSTHATHVRHVKGILGTAMTNRYWNWNIEQQFVCHVVGAWFPSGTYNMESWQPSLSWGQIANAWDRCNRIK